MSGNFFSERGQASRRGQQRKIKADVIFGVVVYLLNLLNKFEVALTWDSRTLLVPSLLPSEETIRAGLPGCDVRVKVYIYAEALR